MFINLFISLNVLNDTLFYTGELGMPGYKGHLCGGVAVFGLVFYGLHTPQTSMVTALEWLGFTLAGALFPDIDVKSKGQKYFYWVVLGVVLFFIHQQWYELLGVTAVCSVVPMLVQHRGLFHKAWFVVGAPALIYCVLSFYFPAIAQVALYDTFFFVLGALSHLYFDVGFKRMFRF